MIPSTHPAKKLARWTVTTTTWGSMFVQQELLPGNVTDPSLGQLETSTESELDTVDLR